MRACRQHESISATTLHVTPFTGEGAAGVQDRMHEEEEGGLSMDGRRAY